MEYLPGEVKTELNLLQNLQISENNKKEQHLKSCTLSQIVRPEIKIYDYLKHLKPLAIKTTT